MFVPVMMAFELSKIGADIGRHTLDRLGLLRPGHVEVENTSEEQKLECAHP